MKRKCDRCDKPATYHSVRIDKGQKIEEHFCEDHAAEAGLNSVKAAHTPINQLLTNFVKLHSGAPAQPADLICENCGLTYTQFRESSLLGCPACYTAFEAPLSPLLERAHEGGTHHVGKNPRRAGTNELRQTHLLRMRKRLQEAVTAEDYELAARLRDEIRQSEEGVA